MPFRRCCRAGILTAAAAVFVLCTTRSALRFEKLSQRTLDNEFLPAIASIKKHPNLYGKNNRFLYHMDIGALHHYAGDFDSSTTYLLKAADIFDELFARSVTNEAAAIMTNDNIRPYRSKPYELVMLHFFLSCNYLAGGNVDDALVETRRVQLFFDEWNRKNRSDLKYDSDAMFHYLSSISYDAAGETSDAMISLFHSIKAFQEGPVSLPAPLRDWAYFMFRINDRESDNRLLQLKPELPREKIAGLMNDATEIIFIGYAGRGPVIEEQSWWGTWIKDGLLVVHHTGANGEQETMTLPAPALPPEELMKAQKGRKTESGTTFHIKFALPQVRTIPSLTNYFSVRCGGQEKRATSIVINDLDKQAMRHLEDSRGTTLARTVVRVVLRTIAAQAAKNRMQTGNTAANLLLNIGTDLLADQLEKADTRSCFLLPKTVQIARLPVKPGIHSIDVEARGADGSVIGLKSFTDITVRAHEKKFVFYPSFR